MKATIVPAAPFKQLKADLKKLPSYSRDRKWKQTQALATEQGFTFSAAQRRQIENIVY